MLSYGLLCFSVSTNFQPITFILQFFKQLNNGVSFEIYIIMLLGYLFYV